MRLSDIEIKEIWPLPREGFTRAMVELEFTDDSFGGDMPVRPAVRIHPFIKHDGTASLEKLEAELLAEAQRLLKFALQTIDGKTPGEIRKEVEASKPAADEWWTETPADAVALEMQNDQPS